MMALLKTWVRTVRGEMWPSPYLDRQLEVMNEVPKVN